MSEYVNNERMGPRSGLVETGDGGRFNWGNYYKGQPHSISRGLCPGSKPFYTNGERIVGNAEDKYPLWKGPAKIPVYAVEGEQVTFSSTSTEDAPGGTGIARFMMYYLDVNLDEKEEEIELNGTTEVTSTATDVRWVQELLVTSRDDVGSNDSAVGDIEGVVNGGSPACFIASGDLTQLSSFMCVPRGKVFFIDGVTVATASATSDSRSTIRLVYSISDLLVSTSSFSVQNGGYHIPTAVGKGFPEGTVVGMTATTNKAAVVGGQIIGRIEPDCFNFEQPVVG